MRVEIISGADGLELKIRINNWLEKNEENKVVLTISPISTLPGGGGYILITYTEKEKVFEKIQ
jgi:hypothetical protein